MRGAHFIIWAATVVWKVGHTSALHQRGSWNLDLPKDLTEGTTWNFTITFPVPFEVHKHA